MSQPAPSKSGSAVWVGCKLPHGLTIFLEEEGLSHDAMPKKIQVRKEGAPVIKLNGSNSSKIFGGYGRTEVPGDFWDEWIGTHRKYPPVVNGSIFVETSRDRWSSVAAERSTLKTGFEQLDWKAQDGIAPDPDAAKRAREAMTPVI